jgi:hypothetical protein
VKTILLILILPLLLLGTACGRKSEVPPEVAAARKLAQAPLPEVPTLSPRDLLTDDKLTRYAIYQREMNTVADLLMGAASQAYNKSGGNQKGFEKELAQDVRTKKIADTEASALAKSGLTRAEAMAVSKLVTSYLPRRSTGTEETKKQARADFETTYGKAAVEVVDKHEAELIKIQDEMVNAMMKGGRK